MNVALEECGRHLLYHADVPFIVSLSVAALSYENHSLGDYLPALFPAAPISISG